VSQNDTYYNFDIISTDFNNFLAKMLKEYEVKQ